MTAPDPAKRKALQKIAIGQIQMSWTIEENCNAIEGSMRLAHARGAAICVFPELAITGFHRKIVDLAAPELVGPAVASIAALCRSLKMAVAVGAPSFSVSGRPRNSYLLVDEEGVISTFSKIGLTSAEKTFFDAGDQRPCVVLKATRCTTVMCREIEDQEDVATSLAKASPELVFWPGLMSPDKDTAMKNPPSHIVQAQELARRLGAGFIQANWPNALNRPEESRNLGESAVIAADGAILFRLPMDVAGTAVFELGATSYDWIAAGSAVQ